LNSDNKIIPTKNITISSPQPKRATVKTNNMGKN